MTDLLAILVIIAIVVVLLDGVRRKLRDRRGRVVLKLDRNIPADNINLDEIPLSELPNGGARRLERASDEIPVIRRKPPVLPSIKKAREADQAPLGAVPVLMETVELDEEKIEHTNVFANGGAVDTFVAEEFDEETFDEEDDEIIDGLDEEYAADARAQHRSNTSDRLVDVEELDDEFDDELEHDVEQQLVPEHLLVDADEVEVPDVLADLDDDAALDFDEDDDDFEDDDAPASPARKQAAAALDDDDDFDEDLDETPFDEELEEDDFEDDDEELTDDDYDDEDDVDSDEELADDEYEDDDAVTSDEELTDEEYEDEFEEGLEEDYENEPLLLQDVYNKAAGHFKRPVDERPRIEPGFGGAAFDEDELEEDFSSAFLDDPELNEELQEEMRPIPVVPRPATSSVPRSKPEAEPNYVQTAHPSYETSPNPTPAESWPPKTAVPVRPSTSAKRSDSVKPGSKKVDQGELFREESLRKAAELEQKPETAGPQEVIIINVMARHGAMFSGTDLLPVLRKQGLHLGEMSIFHRHADLDGNGQVMFSMANMVKPGTFNLAAMESFSTPGVSFFLQLPNKLGNLPSFEKMLAAASAVKANLDGEFKDENRSVFTRQTVEHCRQRIQDFELVLLKHK